MTTYPRSSFHRRTGSTDLVHGASQTKNEQASTPAATRGGSIHRENAAWEIPRVGRED
jgi:hypothetical protein